MATFNNSATLSYNGNVTNSNVITGEILENIALTKTAVSDSYTANADITYVVGITNNGTTELSDLTLTDDLGTFMFNTSTLVPLTYTDGTLLYYVNGVLQTAPAINADPPLVISGINVPAGGNVIIVYEAIANQYAPLATGSTIENTVTIGGEGSITPITAEETISAQSAPSLTISKSLSPTSVAANGQITYTFIIQNSGSTPATVADNIVLADTFNPILSSLGVTFDENTWESPINYTYNTETGEFATVAGQITVPAATYTQDATTGAWSISPGVSTLIVTGTV